MSEDVKRFDGEILAFLMEQKNALTARRPEILDLGDVDSLDELDGTLEQIGKAINAIALAQHEREQGRKRFNEWQKIIPRCRAARDEFARVSIDFQRAEEKYHELSSRGEDARSKVAQARDQRPTADSFPTAEELEKQALLEAKCESALAAVVAKVRAANEKRHELQRTQLEKKIELDQLLFQERNLRPRDAKPRDVTVGELAGVR